MTILNTNYGGGGEEYTAGDGIDITNAVISATNTGKARVLTTADYNYHNSGSVDNGIGWWLLEPGVYRLGERMRVYWYSSGSNDIPAGWTFVVLWAEADWNKTLLYPGNNTTELGKLKVQIVSKTGASVLGQTMFLTQNDVQDNLSSTYTARPLSAKQGKVLKDLIDSLVINGAGAPTTSTVGAVGQIYEDTTNGKVFVLSEIVEESGQPDEYVWEELGGGVNQINSQDWSDLWQ